MTAKKHQEDSIDERDTISATDELGIEQSLRNWRGAIKVKDVSAVIHAANSTVYRYAANGVFPRLLLPGLVRFDPRQLADVLYGKKTR